MKTVEEVVADMPSAKYFSVLDASSGYWQIIVSDESFKLLTFNLPFGRYRFQRLPFGLSSASEVFQRHMSEKFDELEGVSRFVDDILVWGATKEEHNKQSIKVLDVARIINIELSKKKMLCWSLRNST